MENIITWSAKTLVIASLDGPALSDVLKDAKAVHRIQPRTEIGQKPVKDKSVQRTGMVWVNRRPYKINNFIKIK
jgi:hypothetical protein